MKNILLCGGLFIAYGNLQAMVGASAMTSDLVRISGQQEGVRSVMSGLEIVPDLSEAERKKYLEAKEDQLEVLKKTAKMTADEESSEAQLADTTLQQIGKAEDILRAIKSGPHGKPMVQSRRPAGRRGPKRGGPRSPHGTPMKPARR